MPTISGIVKDASGTPCEALVVVKRRDDFSLVDMVFSDASTGAYSITTADTSPHIVQRFFGTTGDINVGYRRLGLHFAGANNSTSIVDVCGNTITVNGDAKIDAVTTDPYGGTSGVLTCDGAGDYVSVTSSTKLDTEANDFSLRFKFNTTQTTDNATLINREWVGSPYSNGWSVQLRAGTGGPLRIYMTSYSTGSPLLVGTTTTHGDGNWHDFEWSYSGGVHKLFLDGSVEATTTTISPMVAAVKDITIGNDLTFGGGGRAYNGKIKDVELFIEKALHTSGFTPPSSTFFDYLIGAPTENAQIFDYVTPV